MAEIRNQKDSALKFPADKRRMLVKLSSDSVVQNSMQEKM